MPSLPRDHHHNYHHRLCGPSSLSFVGRRCLICVGLTTNRRQQTEPTTFSRACANSRMLSFRLCFVLGVFYGCFYWAIDKQRPSPAPTPPFFARSNWGLLGGASSSVPVFWSGSFVSSRLGELIRHLRLPASQPLEMHSLRFSHLPSISHQPSSGFRHLPSKLHPASSCSSCHLFPSIFQS